MKRALAALAQLGIVALGIGLLAALLYEPWIEGVNANATSFRDIYFDDLFLAYIYFASIPVFIGLYQAYMLAGALGQGQSVGRSFRIITYCALTFVGLIIGALTYIAIFIRGTDDIAGGVAIGIFLIVASSLVAFGAHMLAGKWSVPAD